MNRYIFNILWDTCTAALATGILAAKTDWNPIVIGLVVGLYASAWCFFNIKSYEKHMKLVREAKVKDNAGTKSDVASGSK